MASRSSLHAVCSPFLGLFLLTLSACSGKHDGADAGPCVNEPACTCGDGAMGRKVCDLDTHEFVMCLCQQGASSSTERDAGLRSPAREPEAGRAAPAQPPPPAAAGSGGAAASGQNNRGNGRHGR